MELLIAATSTGDGIAIAGIAIAFAIVLAPPWGRRRGD